MIEIRPKNMKCGECKFLDTNEKSTVGFMCTNKAKRFRTNTAHWKKKTEPACKSFEKIDYTEKCWETGVFNSECDCELCEHKYDCSGYEGKDNGDDYD